MQNQLTEARKLACIVSANGINIEIPETANWFAYRELIENAALILTMDTATAHISTALDKPTIVIAGDGGGGQFSWRRSAKQIWLQRNMPCAGCGWVCTQSEPYCITGITEDEIVQAALLAVHKSDA